MQRQGDSQIEERLIGDALTEHMDRVDATRDLWPGIRDRLIRRRRTKLPILVRVAAATALVSLLAVLALVRPWSLLDDSMSPFAAIAHAYDGLFDLETVRYRAEVTNSLGNQWVENHQVDMVNRIEHTMHETVIYAAPGASFGDTVNFETLIINGKQYQRFEAGLNLVQDFGPDVEVAESSESGWTPFPNSMRHAKEEYPWAPFGKFGGLPWSRENAEDSFDKVELIGDTEIDGRPAVHYRATISPARENEDDLPAIVNYVHGKPVENVYRGVEDYVRTVETVDLWVTKDGDTLIKADWMHIERGPPLPADYKERDWCEGLGEFSEPEYAFRVTDSQGNRSYYIGHPGMSLDTHDLAQAICWNEEETEGRKVWGRNIPEHTGEDFWVRWVYTFTGFNEPLDLPDDLPE